MATRKVLKTTTTKPLPSKEKMEKQIAKIKHESMYSPDGTKYEGGGDKKKIAQWKKLDLVRRQTYGKEIKAENKALADKYGKHIQAGENIAAVKEGRTAMNVDGSGQRKRDAVATRKKIGLRLTRSGLLHLTNKSKMPQRYVDLHLKIKKLLK